MGRFQGWKRRGVGKGMSVPPMSGGSCSAPLGTSLGLMDTPSRWCHSCERPALLESGSRGRKDARTGSYGNRVTGQAQQWQWLRRDGL